MKILKILLMTIGLFVLGACTAEEDRNDDPITCEEGFLLQFGECVEDVLVCEQGFHEENGECVESTLECEVGFQEQDGACVEIDTRVSVSGNADVLSSLEATSNVFDMFYHEAFDSSVTYLTNVLHYSVK